MTTKFAEVHDYESIRAETRATVFQVEVNRPTLILGSRQVVDVLQESIQNDFDVRRRRGGGGLVLARPGDVWLDFWIPRGDGRFQTDVTHAARQVGNWWRDGIVAAGGPLCDVYEGPLSGDPKLRVACFAGLGSGELIVDERKSVGVAQWRVREGTLLATILHRSTSEAIVNALVQPPKGLADALLHHSTADSLGIEAKLKELVFHLLDASGPWVHRQISLR